MTSKRLKLTRVAPVAVGLIVLTTFVVVLAVGTNTGSKANQQVLKSSNRAMLSVSARLLFNPLYNLDLATLDRMLNQFLGETNIAYAAVRNARGQVVSEVTEDWMPKEQDSRDLAAQAFTQKEIVQREIGGYLASCGPIAAGPEQIGTLEIFFDQAPLQVSAETMQRTMLPVVLLLFTGSVLLVALFVRYASSSLRALIAAAGEIGRGNLDISIPISGMQETAALGTALEKMRSELQTFYSDQEKRVFDLERRAKQLQSTVEITQETTLELDTSTLLQRLVSLISKRFDFYYTSIFLLDDSGQRAVLQASFSQDGQRILKKGYQVQLKQDNAVGYATIQGEPYVATNLEETPNHVDFPDTRSELALPLQARGEIFGALDIHSKEFDAFTKEDIRVLQILANQVAMTISNAQLFQQAQENLMRTQKVYSDLSRGAWSGLLQDRPIKGYYCDAKGVVSATEFTTLRDDESLPAISIPITVRDQVIGTVSARKPNDAGEWTAEETALMRALTDQLNVALESARLYQDTQRRAVQEQLIGEISTRVRETLDMDTMLQTAIREIGKALDLPEIEVRLQSMPTLDR